jgi:hypothetical protein
MTKSMTPQDGLAWLDDPGGQSEDPWVLSSDDTNEGHAAFIVNRQLRLPVNVN